MKKPRWLTNLYLFYRDGFKNMTVGRTLWLLVIVKLFIMFGILKVFFFPNFLNSKFDNEEDKANFVKTELVERSTASTLDSINKK